jgi:predicted DNA-binding transcriptional regulator AlpA
MKPDNNNNQNNNNKRLVNLPPFVGKGPNPAIGKSAPPNDGLTKPFYSIREVAALIGMSKRHVDRLVEKGEIPEYIDNALPDTTKQQIRIARETIREYLEKRKRP